MQRYSRETVSVASNGEQDEKQKAHSQEWAFCFEAGAGSGNRTRIISLEG
jgi:hypothetical protein